MIHVHKIIDYYSYCDIHNTKALKCLKSKKYFCKECDSDFFKIKYNAIYLQDNNFSLKSIEKIGKLLIFPKNVVLSCFYDMYYQAHNNYKISIGFGFKSDLRLINSNNDIVIPFYYFNTTVTKETNISIISEMDLEINAKFILKQMINDNLCFIDNENNLVLNIDMYKKYNEYKGDILNRLNNKIT